MILRLMSSACLGLALWAVPVVILSSAEGDQHLHMLSNDQVELGVLLAGAGRAVVFRLRDQDNVLDGKPETWDPAAIPQPEYLKFIDLGGHMVWVGPQNDWWTKQTVTDKHWGIWPPDPWTINSTFSVESATADSLTVVGPTSPVTGLQMRKSYQLHDHSVTVTTTATNTTQAPVTWGLWSNLHPVRHAEAFVPLTKGSKVDIHYAFRHPNVVLPMRYTLSEPGAYFFKPIAQSQEHYQGKAFISNSPNWMAAFANNWCLIVEIDDIPDKEIAPTQAAIEIYVAQPTTSEPLLELEHHGRYQTIQPGDTTQLNETWRIVPYSGSADPAARISFATAQMDRSVPSSE